jgi:hypothetical protein
MFRNAKIVFGDKKEASSLLQSQNSTPDNQE